MQWNRWSMNKEYPMRIRGVACNVSCHITELHSLTTFATLTKLSLSLLLCRRRFDNFKTRLFNNSFNVFSWVLCFLANNLVTTIHSKRAISPSLEWQYPSPGTIAHTTHKAKRNSLLTWTWIIFVILSLVVFKFQKRRRPWIKLRWAFHIRWLMVAF